MRSGTARPQIRSQSARRGMTAFTFERMHFWNFVRRNENHRSGLSAEALLLEHAISLSFSPAAAHNRTLFALSCRSVAAIVVVESRDAADGRAHLCTAIEDSTSASETGRCRRAAEKRKGTKSTKIRNWLLIRPDVAVVPIVHKHCNRRRAGRRFDCVCARPSDSLYLLTTEAHRSNERIRKTCV